MSGIAGAKFKGDGKTPGVTGTWLASEVFATITGNATAGVCAPSQAVGSGAYTPTGPQTLCCL